MTARVGILPRTLGRNLGELRRFLGGAGDAGVAVGQPGPGGAALGQLVHQRHPGRPGSSPGSSPSSWRNRLFR